MWKLSRVAFLLGLIALVISLAAHDLYAQRKQIAFVLSLEGKWLADGQPLRIGQAILAGSSIVPIVARTTRSITLVYANGTRQTYPCKPPERSQAAGSPQEACGFKTQESINPVAPGSRLGEAFRLIFGNPERYATVLSRGAVDNRGSLRDAVVQVASGSIDANPFMRDISPGTYALRFRSVPRDGTSLGTATILNLDWNEKRTSFELPAGVGPGLYQVELTSPDANPIGDEAWILLAAAPAYGRSRAAFAEALAIADSWGRDVPEDRRRFLHASLDRLANQP